MRKISLLATTLLLSCSLQAQEKPSQDLNLQYSWGGKFNLIDQDGLKVQSNLKKQKMYTLLADYPAGLDLYGQYRKSKTLSNVFGWTAAGTSVAGLTCILASIDWETDDLNEGLFYTGIGLLGVTILSGVGTISFGIISKSRGYKLSSAYNSHQERYSLNFGVTNHGIGLVMKF